MQPTAEELIILDTIEPMITGYSWKDLQMDFIRDATNEWGINNQGVENDIKSKRTGKGSTD